MFEPMNFIYNLPYLLKGVLGTFVALGAISLSVIFLHKITIKK